MATTSTTNIDIDYVVKDFTSSVDAMISYATVNFGPGTSSNRLWTNYNVDSFSRNWLEINALMSDILFFYMDQQATQSYLQTATIRSAVYDIAAQFGFTPSTAQSASGNATFTFTSAGTIPRGFRVSASNGIEFFVTNDIVAGLAGDYTGTVLQGINKSESKISQGLQNEEFNLAGPNVIVDQENTNANDISPQVTVNGNSYTLVSSFLRHPGTDTPAILDTLGNVIGGGRVFTLSLRPDGTPYIRFGDGIFGRKLLAGETVLVKYRAGGGTSGNIGKETLTTLTDTLSFVTAVKNTADFSGGADEQSIEQLRELIPASLRTLERAVSKQDYSDLIIANFNEVFTATAEQNQTDPGVDINVYVVPQGSSITQITSNTLLLNQLNDFIDRRKMVTIQFQILDAFGIDTLITLEVFVTNTTSRSVVETAIRSALTTFFDLNSGSADGSGMQFAEPILLKDISNLFETIPGIERYEIKRLTYRPRVDKKIQGLVTTYNFSDITLYPNISESEWLITAAGQQTETAGGVVFSNPTATGYTYDTATGTIAYTSNVDLSQVAPGDSFRNGPGLAEVTRVATVGDSAGANEITTVVTVADKQGLQEVTDITTVADVGGSLNNKFFKIYDIAGSVGVWFNNGSGSLPSMGTNRDIQVNYTTNDSANNIATALKNALDADSQFVATVINNVVTVTNVDKCDVTDAHNGAASPGFGYNVTTQGENPDSLGGTYFDVPDGTNVTRFWFDTGSSTQPSNPGRRIQVVISPNATANSVASALYATLNPDSGSRFTATLSGNTVTITDVNVGNRTNASDGALPTGFTISTFQNGATPDVIPGKYFDITDDVGTVRVWYTTGSTVAPATPSGGRLLPVTMILGDNAATIASKTQLAVDADAKFIATVSGNVVTITDASIGPRTDGNSGISTFTVSTLVQGIAAGTDFTIRGVDAQNDTILLDTGLSVNTTPGINAGGSVRNGSTSFEAGKVFKKINGTATNLSLDSITDNTLDLSVFEGTGTNIEIRTLLDNTNVFTAGEFTTGDLFLVDAAGNIWEIIANTSNTITVAANAVNDSSIVTVTAGSYSIVRQLIGYEIIFNSTIFTIQYNNKNTIFAVGSQFNQIGTIGDSFQISKEQANVINLGIAADIVSFNDTDQTIELNGAPDLSGVNATYSLIDSSGQIFNIVEVNNTSLPSTFYSSSNQDSEFLLKASGAGVKYSQGFKVPTTSKYSAITFNLRKQGNIVGNLTASIYNDSLGLPNNSSVVAVSKLINISTLSETSGEIVFTFTNPPTLSAGVQYHLVISSDTIYQASQRDNFVIFTNPTTYTYNTIDGKISYATAVNLAPVLPGHFFKDGAGTYFKISAVDNTADTLTIGVGLTVNTSTFGDVVAKDNVYIGYDNSSPTYTNGNVSSFNGTIWTANTLQDLIFSVESPKSIRVESNLIPVLGAGGTISKRYYDDSSEMSLIAGLSNGAITSATDANALARGTVGGIPDSLIDYFIFRTSRYADDIVTLRNSEIPQIKASDITINTYGGIA